MDAGNPQSLNRYAYVGNRPTVFTDPSGLEGGTGSLSCFAVAAGTTGPAGEAICGISLLVDAFFIDSFFHHPKFTGATATRPGAIWDEHGSYHATPNGGIGDILGLPTAGCEFGACGYLPQSGPVIQQASVDIGSTLAGYALNLVNLLVYTPANREAPRRYFGSYWCGPGGAGPTGGIVNGACYAHDLCFGNARINADGNTNGSIYWSPGQTSAAKVCNQILYDAVRGSDESGAAAIQQWLLHGEGYILRPGTAAHP